MSTIRLTIDHDGTEFVTESTVDDDPSLPDMLAGVHAAGVAWLEAGARITGGGAVDQRPSEVMAAEEALRRHRHDWADYFENWIASVGTPPLTAEIVISTLRTEHVPFECTEAKR